MKILKYVLIFVLILPMQAQPIPTEKVERLLLILGQDKIADKMYEDQIEYIETKKNFVLEHARNDAEKERWKRGFDEHQARLEKVTAWVHVKAYYIELFSQHFDEREIDAMIDFYGSEIGRKVYEKQNLMAEKLADHTESSLMKELNALFEYIGPLFEEAASRM